jgi:hypothetical protein
MGIANNFTGSFRRIGLVVGLLLSSLCASSQAWLDRPVSINETASRASLLFLLSEQADFGLAFSSKWPDFKEQVTIKAEQLPAREVLDLILSGSKLTYKATDSFLTVKRKNILLSGYLEDASSGERLVGGNVFAADSRRGTITNAYGFFSLELPASDSLVQFSYLGYEATTIVLPFNGNVRLQPAAELPEVVVIAYPATSGVSAEGQAGFTRRISGRQLRRHAGSGGEADLFDLVHQTTDSQRGADGLGGLFVRGGGADQNLVLLDDVPVFQPSHAFGLFSVINPAIVRSATFYQDGFPARYGERLASVLDVRSREGNTEHASAELAFSSIATKLTLEVPTFNNQGAFLLAGRRTHLDPLIAGVSRRRKDNEGSEGEINYDFYDLNLKWHHTLSPKDKIYLSGYRGGDAYDNVNFTAFDLEEDGQPIAYEEELDQDLNWGNTSGTLRWNHLFNDRLFANTTLTYGKYRYLSDNLLDTREAGPTDTLDALFYGRFESVIRDLNLKIDVDYYRNRHHWRFGAFALARRFLPGAVFDEFSEDTIRREEIISVSEERFDYPGFNSVEGGIYLEDQLELSKNWQLSTGLRLAAYRFGETIFFRPQPRLRLGWNTGGRAAARLSLDRMVQPLHLLTNSGANLPTDLWVPATTRFAPQDSWQVSLSGNWAPQPAWHFQLNAYYKTMRQQLRYPDEVNWPGLEENPAEFWEDQVLQGNGYSYGTSLNIQHRTDRQLLSGGYFFSRGFREFPEVNNGEAFPFAFDRPHKIILNLEQQLTRSLHLHVHWELTSGRPITLLLTDTEFDPLDNFPSFSYEQLSDLNGFRLPAYHRLDLALEWQWQKSRKQQPLRIGVYNAYNRANAYYAYDFEDSFSGTVEQREVRSLPILPSLSYSIRFGE